MGLFSDWLWKYVWLISSTIELTRVQVLRWSLASLRYSDLFVIAPHPPKKTRNFGLKVLLCTHMAFPHTTRSQGVNWDLNRLQCYRAREYILTTGFCRFYKWILHTTIFDFVQLGWWLDYLCVKLWSVINFHPLSRDENVWKLCIFMLGCDFWVSLVVKNLNLDCW